jgi:hypothetical protein
MVKALLNGTKKQTRRTHGLEKVNEFLQGDPHNHSYAARKYHNGKLEYRIEVADKSFVVTPKAEPGDIFWVRESFYKTTAEGLGGAYYYKASVDPSWDLKFKPSIHMPKEACRLFLKVLDVRLERLHDISNVDAKKEGIEDHYLLKSRGYKHYTRPDLFIPKGYKDAERTSFFSLWMHINGNESLDQNPWVWVYEFVRTNRPETFLQPQKTAI